jgi:hypothetical protein
MAIGISRSAGYNYAGTTGALNGVASTSPLNQELGQSVALYLVDAGLDLSGEDDAANEAFEAILQAMPAVLAYYAHATSGAISFICDGVNAPSAASLQTAIQAIGSTKGSVNLGSTTVTAGTSFVVA